MLCKAHELPPTSGPQAATPAGHSVPVEAARAGGVLDASGRGAGAASGPPQGGALGKNRASPPSARRKGGGEGPILPAQPKKGTPPNRAHVRLATASRLMAGHWRKTGENLRGSSVLGCGRWRNYGADPNIAEIELAENGPRMVGHFACRAVWSCDHCARGRVAQTRGWLRGALFPALEARSMTGGLLTFTMAHAYGDDWAEVVARLHKAFALFDRRMSKWYTKAGSLGKLKALEAPVGSNGLHPHLHVLLTYRKGFDTTEMAEAMRTAWDKAVAEVGGRCNEHGFDFKPGCLNDYPAKLEAAHEMASHGTKAARRKGRTLAQLLDRAAVGDKQAAAEWLRAQAALGGRMRFHAGGLPKKLGIECPSEWEETPDLDESEAVEKPEPVRITYPQRDHLNATNTTHGRAGLAMILRAARGGDVAQVRRVVAALCEAHNRAEESACRAGSFWHWTEDRFREILDEAAKRPLKPDEVGAYIEAKARNITPKDQPMTDAQRLHLDAMAEGFGMSTSEAAALDGAALDAWIDEAEDAMAWALDLWEPDDGQRVQRVPPQWSPLVVRGQHPQGSQA